MLLSDKYRFIFIKTTKTAGTSVEVDLSHVLAETDIATPIIPAVEGHRPRNYAPTTTSCLTKALAKLRMVKPRRFYNQMGAKAVRDAVGPRVFNRYFKFCIEREPVSKCISYYSMIKNSPHHSKGHSDLTWDAYVERGAFPVDTDKYVDENGELIVDYILRYECLDQELTELSKWLGFPFAGVKAKAKSGLRETITPSAAQKQKIYDAFASSLKHCPYDMP